MTDALEGILKTLDEKQRVVPPTNGSAAAKASGKEMPEGELAWIVQAKMQNSIGFQGGKLSQLRQQAERYYRGDKFGNEVKGRSQVVSHDVAEAIDSMMPSLIKIFTSGEEVVRFDPSAKEAPDGASVAATLQLIKRAEDNAKQATEYVNWIWNSQNPGFLNFYTWFKSALMMKNGIIKIWWDTAPTSKKETYKGLTDEEFEAILEDDAVTVESDETRPDPDWSPQQAYAQLMSVQPGQDATKLLTPPLVHDCVLLFTNKSGRVRIVAVPEDEFLIDRRAVSLDETPFCAHRQKMTISDLKEMFPDKHDLIDGLTSGEEAEYSQERIERFKDEDELPWRQDNPADPSMREIWVTEAYIKVDCDGDGIAELRKVTVAGDTGYTIIDNVEFDEQPFSSVTPILMPHKFFGMSVTDQTTDVQLIKSTLIRGILDNMYNQISPQLGVVENQANLDDLLNRRPGGVVRLKSATALVPIESQGVGPEPYQMVEYFDTVREQRTGVTRYNQGLDADTLNKTAKGINLIQNAGQERLELIARVFAETGVKQAFLKVLQLVCKHQDKKHIIRLRGKWVAMDPREWTDQMDVSVNVGLGTGSRDQQMQLMMMLLNLDKEIVELQGGAQGPLVTMENIYNKLEKLAQFSGLGSVQPFYTNPAQANGQPGGPQQHMDPKVQAEQLKQQHAAQELQQKADDAEKERQMRLQLGMAELALKRELGLEDLQLRRQQLNLEAASARVDAHLEHARLETDTALKVAGHNHQVRTAEQTHALAKDNAQHDRSVKRDKLDVKAGGQPRSKPSIRDVMIHRDPTTGKAAGFRITDVPPDLDMPAPGSLPTGAQMPGVSVGA